MLKAGIVRGAHLGIWEAQQFEKLPQFGIKPIAIVTEDVLHDIKKLKFEKRVFKSLGQITGLKKSKLRLALLKKTNLDIGIVDRYIRDFKNAVKDIDVLHSLDPFYIFSYQSVRSGKPTVITMWENIPFLGDYTKPHPAMVYYGRRIAAYFKNYVKQNAAHFVAVSEKARDVLELEGVEPEKISVIPAGIDTTVFKPSEKSQDLIAKYNLKNKDAIILFVGRLVWEKGIIDLILAVHNVLKQYDVTLLIAGKGPLKKSILRLAAKLNIKTNLVLLGSVDYFDMPTIYNLADIFCLPSIPIEIWQEQFGYVLIEAMSCGIPVVASNTGAIPEIVMHNKTGILVPPADRFALSEALETLIEDAHKRKTFSANARAHAVKNFDALKIAQKLAGVYKKVV
jgi:glycosyltransferase involved in cell wall biosynthesis